MDTVIRAFIIYFMLWGLLRLAGRRTLGELNTFDLVLLLVIGGATQRALLGQDYSVTTAFLIVATLILTDVGLTLLMREFPFLTRIINGEPMVIVEHGRPLSGRLARARVSTSDVLAAARHLHGLERMEDIKFAILEANGKISVIPYASLNTVATVQAS
jgi:uncharacterized membrane protein YcaP (DUF421 family)